MDMEDKLRHAANRAREEGRLEGRQEGTLATLTALVESGTITLQTAAEAAEMSEADFKKKMTNMSKT